MSGTTDLMRRTPVVPPAAAIVTPPPPLASTLRRTAAVLCMLLATAIAVAQPDGSSPWRVGVIASASAGSAIGALQARVAERFAEAYARVGVFGTPLVVDVRDDAGDPRRAEALALALIDDGVLALVCCSSPAASERVSAVAEAAGVVLLGLDGATGGGHVWTLPLRADARTQMTAAAVHLAEEGKSAMALMTLDNAFGDAAADAFERALADAGRVPVGTVRYAPSASVLTPEALWAATREPGAIVVWGLTTDTDRALRGLRARGWFGPAYVRPETIGPATWRRLTASAAGPTAPPTDGDPWWQVRSAVSPITVVETLPADHPNLEAARAALARIDGLGVRLDPSDVGALALVDDALMLLQRAFEEVAALALPPGLPVSSVRQAVLDALVSAPSRPLAAGTYHARSGDPRLARWQGLVVVMTR
jgi:ABC-type branched-subunit amino acid transport system substrate-binding protein